MTCNIHNSASLSLEDKENRHCLYDINEILPSQTARRGLDTNYRENHFQSYLKIWIKKMIVH